MLLDLEWVKANGESHCMYIVLIIFFSATFYLKKKHYINLWVGQS